MNIDELLYRVRGILAKPLRYLSRRGINPFAESDGDHRGASGYLERGRRYYNRKDYERAVRYFKKSVLADESYALAHYYLGLGLYKLDDSEAAMRSWRRTTEIAPHSDIGAKALKKMGYAKKHMTRTLAELESHVRDD